MDQAHGAGVQGGIPLGAHINGPPIVNQVNREHRRGRILRQVIEQRQPEVRPPPEPRRQKYRYEWQVDPARRRWLRRVPLNEHRAQCIACNRTVNAHLGTIDQHALSNRHQRAMAALVRLEGPDDPNWYDFQTVREFEDEVARIRTLVGVFIVEHGLAHVLVGDLYDLAIKISVYPEALKRARMLRLTLSKMLKWALARAWKEELYHLLLTQKFALMFDESTDVSTQKHGCMVARVWHPRLRKFVSVLWALFGIYDIDEDDFNATAESIFGRIVELLLDIPEEQMMEFIADGAASMMGENNSVRTRFEARSQGITIIICPNHAIALCSKHAATDQPDDAIPIDEVYLCRDMYSFLNTAQRKIILQQRQVIQNMDVKCLKKPILTRWLSMGPAIDTLVENWEPVRATLVQVAQQRNATAAARALVTRMDDPLSKGYQLFQRYMHPSLENLSGWMQSNDVIIHQMYGKIKETYLDILDCFMEPEYLQRTPVAEIDPRDARHHRDLRNIQIGQECTEYLIRVGAEMGDPAGPLIVDFVVRIYRYLVRLATEMSVRLESYWRQYAILDCLQPENAVSAAYHAQNPDIIRLVMGRFPRALHGVNALEIEREWDQLLLFHPPIEPDTKIELFWENVRAFQNPEQPNIHNHNQHQGMSFNLGQFVMNILCISHSNAECERKFSAERLIKTRLRCNLSLDTLEATLMLRECVRVYGFKGRAAHFEPTERMIELVRERRYNHPDRARNVGEDSEDEDEDDHGALDDDEQ